MLNLTQHLATPEQIEAGVINLHDEDRAKLSELLTFEQLPTIEDIEKRCVAITSLAKEWCLKNEHPFEVLIGGAPFLMPTLESCLYEDYFSIRYAFSRRESTETIIDGKTIKTNVFKHLGFIKVDHYLTEQEEQYKQKDQK